MGWGSSAGTKSGSRAYSLVVPYHVGARLVKRIVQGPATARRRSVLGTCRPRRAGHFGRRFASAASSVGALSSSLELCIPGRRAPYIGSETLPLLYFERMGIPACFTSFAPILFVRKFISTYLLLYSQFIEFSCTDPKNQV